MITASLSEISLGRDPEPCAKRLKQDRHQVGKQNDAQECVTKSRSAGEIGRPVARVHVTDRDQITRTGKCEHLPPKSRARRNRNGAMRFRQTRRSAFNAPPPVCRKLIMHSAKVTASFGFCHSERSRGISYYCLAV